MEDNTKPISEMSDEEFEKLQTDVANENFSHFDEIEEDSEENKNTDKDSEPDADKDEEPEDKPDGDSPDGEDEGEDDDKGKGEEDDKKDEPPIRKSKKDHIIERLRKKNEKLQKKFQEEEEDLDEDEVNPEDRKLFKKVIYEEIGEDIETLKQLRIEEEEAKEFANDIQEVDNFIAKNEEFKPYRDKIIKWSQHPSRKNLPIKAIAYELAGDDLIAIGAERERKASKDAAASATGADASNATLEKKVSEMTDKEFEEYQNKVLYGK